MLINENLFDSDTATLDYLGKSISREAFEKGLQEQDLVVLNLYGRDKRDDEDFVKSMNKAGLVYVQRTVTRNGKTHTQGFWVKQGADKAKHFRKKSGDKIKDTKSLHVDSEGKYTSERADLHDKIVEKVLNQCGKPAPGQKPVAILMGGGSATGKSTMKKLKIDPMMSKNKIKAGTCDPDAFKAELPEYNSLIKTHMNDAARLAHSESADINMLAIDRIVEDGRHFIYDGTAKSPDKYEKLVKKLKDKGYEVHLYGADIPLELSKKISDKRAEDTGRTVPHFIIEASHKGFPKTVERIKDAVDVYEIYDNRVQGKSKLIASNDYVDPESYTEFLKKGGISYNVKANR